MIHYMKLHDRPFEYIKSKIKTIELRLNDEKRSIIKTDDTIIFTKSADENESITAKVTGIYKFASFEELYKTLPLEKCGYLPHELSTASPEDMNAYYSTEKQQKYGVVGIEIQII